MCAYEALVVIRVCLCMHFECEINVCTCRLLYAETLCFSLISEVNSSRKILFFIQAFGVVDKGSLATAGTTTKRQMKNAQTKVNF